MSVPEACISVPPHRQIVNPLQGLLWHSFGLQASLMSQEPNTASAFPSPSPDLVTATTGNKKVWHSSDVPLSLVNATQEIAVPVNYFEVRANATAGASGPIARSREHPRTVSH